MSASKIIIALAVLVVFACKKNSGGGQTPSSNTVTVQYAENPEDFPNPERGFYRYTETRASNYTPLIQSRLESWRGLTYADGGNYQVYSTLVFRYFVLDIFKNSAISAAFLQAMKNDFDIARTAGVKLIPRFVYTTTPVAGNCAESFNCPPYGDAPKNIVLQHLAQLKPVLAEGADVIAVVQLGFIGTWGEGYYTDHFGDASQNGQRKLLDNNWQDRNEVIRALLDATPKDRMIQVRYPQMKQRLVFGVSAPVTSAPLTEQEAFTLTEKARIGYHNDCLLSGTDDYGTYHDYGNSSQPRQSANTELRSYFKADSKFVAVGGETCDDAYSPQNDCEPAGMAETELRDYHYSYLNCTYNNAVNNDWQVSNCMQSIRRKLGYRFVLNELTHTKEITAGSTFNLSFTLINQGYAAPFNERPAILVMRNKTTGQEFKYPLGTDVRKWYTGTIKVEAGVASGSITAGTYELLLFFPDKYAAIAARPEYAIQLANAGVWESSTGYNKLNTAIVVR